MSVYLVQFSEDPSLIKIGYSKTPRERIKTLESYYGPALHIYTIKDEDPSTLERKLHKLFKHCRTSLPPRTEWYKRPRPGRTEFFKINSFKEILIAANIPLSNVKERRYRRDEFKYSRSVLFKGQGLRPRL